MEIKQLMHCRKDKNCWYECDKLEVLNAILYKALLEIADPYDCKWYKSSHDADDVVDTMMALAREALQKAGGE